MAKLELGWLACRRYQVRDQSPTMDLIYGLNFSRLAGRRGGGRGGCGGCGGAQRAKTQQVAAPTAQLASAWPNTPSLAVCRLFAGPSRQDDQSQVVMLLLGGQCLHLVSSPGHFRVLVASRRLTIDLLVNGRPELMAAPHEGRHFAQPKRRARKPSFRSCSQSAATGCKQTRFRLASWPTRNKWKCTGKCQATRPAGWLAGRQIAAAAKWLAASLPIRAEISTAESREPDGQSSLFGFGRFRWRAVGISRDSQQVALAAPEPQLWPTSWARRRRRQARTRRRPFACSPN